MSKMFKYCTTHDLCLVVKPCPKCKSDPDLMAWYIKGVANHLNFAVVCQSCGHRLGEPYKFRSPVKAIEFWNKQGEEK